jgi:hypothetical protein
VQAIYRIFTDVLAMLPLSFIEHLYEKFTTVGLSSFDNDSMELLHSVTRVALQNQQLLATSAASQQQDNDPSTTAATTTTTAPKHYGLAIYWNILQDGANCTEELVASAMRHMCELFQHQVCTEFRYEAYASISQCVIVHCQSVVDCTTTCAP